MATHRIPIIGFGAIPDTSGEVYFEPYKITDTAALLDPLVLVFEDSGTKDGIKGSFRVPENYFDTPVLLVVWTADAVAGTFVLDWTVLTRSGVEDMGDPTPTRDTETDTVTKSATAFAREESNMPLTDGDYVAGDEVLFELFRDTITDSMAAKALVFGVYFEYADA